MIAHVLLGHVVVSPAQSATTHGEVAAAVKPYGMCPGAGFGRQWRGGGTVPLGEEEARRGETSPKGSVERSRRFAAADQHLGKADALAVGADARAGALGVASPCSTTPSISTNLGVPGGRAAGIGSPLPADLAPVFRLPRFRRINGSSRRPRTRCSARCQHPDSVEPYMKLAQFTIHAVRSGHAHRRKGRPRQPAGQAKGTRPASIELAGRSRCRSGWIGRSIWPSAQAASVDGVVIVRKSSSTNRATSPRRRLCDPFRFRLDEEAVRAVRNWHATNRRS